MKIFSDEFWRKITLPYERMKPYGFSLMFVPFSWGWGKWDPRRAIHHSWPGKKVLFVVGPFRLVLHRYLYRKVGSPHSFDADDSYLTTIRTARSATQRWIESEKINE